MEQHPQRFYEGDSSNLEKLCFHEIPRKEVLSLQDALRCSTHTSTIGDVTANSMSYMPFPIDAPTRARISFVWFTRDAVLQETRLSILRLLREFL
jgi:hypothetical protein